MATPKIGGPVRPKTSNMPNSGPGIVYSLSLSLNIIQGPFAKYQNQNPNVNV